VERIKDKMVLAPVRAGGAQKECLGSREGGGNRRIDGIYTPAFSRARGVT
jgi:hypothetical protein